jgi:F-type H+-transporting ATPase subunit a
MAQPHISISAETLFFAGPLPITNSLLSTWVVMAILFLFAFVAGSNIKKHPSKFQIVIEACVGGLYGFFRKLGGKHGEHYAPIVTTFFLFIIVSNWFGLLPGVGTIGFHQDKAEGHAKNSISKVLAIQSVSTVEEKSEDMYKEHQSVDKHTKDTNHSKESKTHSFVPLFRGPTADLNTTIALASIAFFSIQYFGLQFGGSAYLKRFFDFRSPIFFFVGILEAISDLSKILSFAFRLFGNIFAGEVLLAIMAFLFAFLLPIPFYGLEIFVGFIQALVFSMLTTVFINVAVSHGEHTSEHHREAHA